MSVFNQHALAGKVALIAGGSSGINLGIAQCFARHGAKVAVLSRDEQKIAAAAESITGEGFDAIGIAADVRDFDAVDRAFRQAAERYGAIDIVVSGAAGNFVAPANAMSSNGFRTVVEIDLIGTFNVLRASFPYLRKPGASLLSITAPQATNPMMQQAHVCAAKAGVNMLTQCLAMEWGAHGIRVNAISPGPIADTEGMRRLASTPDAESSIKARLALRCYGTKQDIADTALFLCSPNAGFITGAIIECDGGCKLGDASEMPADGYAIRM